MSDLLIFIGILSCFVIVTVIAFLFAYPDDTPKTEEEVSKCLKDNHRDRMYED